MTSLNRKGGLALAMQRLRLRSLRSALVMPLFFLPLRTVAQQSTAGSVDPKTQVAQLLINHAELNHNEAQYPSAVLFFNQAINTLEKLSSPPLALIAAARSRLGLAYRGEADFADAQTQIEQARDYYHRTEGDTSRDFAIALDDLAEVYQDQGRFADAEKLLIQVQAIVQNQSTSVQKDSDLERSQNDLGALYEFEGRFKDAEPLLKESADYWQTHQTVPPDPYLQLSLNNLAWSDATLGIYNDAELLLQKVVEIAKDPIPKNPGESKIDYVTRLDKLGRLAPQNAKELGAARLNLADLYKDEGKYTQAESLYKLLPWINGDSSATPIMVKSQISMAALYYAMARPNDAIRYFNLAFSNMRDLFTREFAHMSETDRLSFLELFSGSVSIYLSFSSAYHNKYASVADNVYDLLVWRKLLVGRTIASAQATLIANGGNQVQTLLSQLTSAKNRYAGIAESLSKDSVNPQADIDQLQNAEAEVNRLEEQLEQQASDTLSSSDLIGASASVANELGIEAYDLSRGKAAIVPEAAVEVAKFDANDGRRWTGKSHYIAVALVEDGLKGSDAKWIDLGDADSLEAYLKKTYYASIADPEKATAGVSDDPLAFYDAFWKPILTTLGDVDRIYISADGDLDEVNLDLVPTPDGHLIMDRHDVRLLNSTADLIKSGTPSNSKDAVLFGNPYFDISEADYRKALAALAIKEEGSLFSGVPSLGGPTFIGGQQPLDQRETSILEAGLTQHVVPLLTVNGWTVHPPYFEYKALVEAVEQIKGPRLLHIATHGRFFPDPVEAHSGGGGHSNISTMSDPLLRSQLYFAGANHSIAGDPWPQGISNGILTAYQASTLNLHGTELVVLSACDTGQGNVKSGEGVFGLRRAFQEAGAQSVLMTLWEVPPAHTEKILSFYKYWLSDRMDKHDALRKAENDIRTSSKGTGSNVSDLPQFDWGGFILVGR
jgi:CHAT domain-containing protein/tetratricopeptide repeat protein